MPNQEYFVRVFDIDVLNKSLKLCQKFEGDVGCVVWDASIVLAKYLEELYKKDQNRFRDLNVLELGSGVGCVGLTAACFGANVLLTDLPNILPLLEENVELNKQELENTNGKAQVASLPWGQSIKLQQTPNLIVFADCIYYRESIDKLISTLRDISGPATKILLAQELRDTELQKNCWKYFLDTIKTCFNLHFVPSENQNPKFKCEKIVLVELLPL